MSPKTKKIRRQKGADSKRRASIGSSGGVQRQRGGAASRASSSRPSPGTLTRGRANAMASPGRPVARQARANAMAGANADSTSPKVARPPALQRSNATRDLHKKAGQKADKTKKPKTDFATGRTLFPVDRGNGKIDYLPMASEASDHERGKELFVSDDSIEKPPVNTLSEGGKSTRDFSTGRTVFATKNPDGKTEYLPKQSDATPLELSRGKYVSDGDVEAPSKAGEVLDGKRPRYEFATGRNLFATKNADGKTEYLPKKSEATARELKDGRYVADNAISQKAPLGAANAMTNKKPKYDLFKGRKVYAVVTGDGKTRYLPRESDASDLERMGGLTIPDDVVDGHEKRRRRTALKGDNADHKLRRAQRAAKRAGAITSRPDRPIVPITRAKDGKEIWDGESLPEVSEENQRETLKKFKPKYDLFKGRMLWPTETAKGKIEYLPLRDDATNDERIDGRYAAFAPPEPLEEFLQDLEDQDTIQRRTFDTEQGEVKAYAREAIEDAFESAPILVLRAAGLVEGAARETPRLRQAWGDSLP
uniref:Uncharacterized protein n=1 Tax=Candidatus Kentrum sp. UNK TaxID=2126344 RepID=A0A451ACX0_9GAMM|nr:MAG: hypothetical protein BECKUNK1418G_GA0071005_10385 [Candidatus Kentron sp. UNK]VFK70944.1 MAG: hypothetical protein BECKUNK1418H_GA0071006_10445 [Candidatus Kentron sp. UNK]